MQRSFVDMPMASLQSEGEWSDWEDPPLAVLAAEREAAADAAAAGLHNAYRTYGNRHARNRPRAATGVIGRRDSSCSDDGWLTHKYRSQ